MGLQDYFKNKKFIVALCILLFCSNGLSGDSIDLHVTSNDTLMHDTNLIQEDFKPYIRRNIRKVKEETHWIPVDSQRLLKPDLFRSKRLNFQNELEQNKTHIRISASKLRTSYSVWLGFVIFLSCAFLFGRLFPIQFRMQWEAFYSNSGMRRLLETGSDWFEGEKLFPFFMIVLFTGTWLGFFMSEFVESRMGLGFTAWLLGVITVCSIFIIGRFIQHVYGFAVNIETAMSSFIKSSFNTVFILSFLMFPLSMLVFVNFTGTFPFLFFTIILIYIIRTFKSIFLCLSKGGRAVLYLILYLCAFEIPIVLLGWKWIIKLGD